MDRLYADHATGLLKLAVLACRDRQVAEDVVHDAFVRCSSSSPGPAPGSERAYLRRTVLNLASNHHRSVRRRSDDRLPVAVPADGADVVAIDRDVASLVVEATRVLPARQRDCVLLHYFEGLTVAEIADELDVSVGSVKTHLHRARPALRDALEDLR